MKLVLIVFAASVVFAILVVERVRRPPPIAKGPAFSAPGDSRPQQLAIVEPRADLQLVKVRMPSPQNDEDAAVGIRPAWEILVLAICVFSYLYLHYSSHTVTVL